MPLSVVAMLAVAVPGTKWLARDSARAGTVNTVLLALRSARQSSHELAKTVTVCPASPEAEGGCAPGQDWSHGLVAFVDLNGDGAMSRREAALVLWQIKLKTPSVIVTADQAAFSFSPFYVRGYTARETRGRFTVCDTLDPGRARTIRVEPSRRAELAPVDASDAVRRCPT